jgi:hypothetical protein
MGAGLRWRRKFLPAVRHRKPHCRSWNAGRVCIASAKKRSSGTHPSVKSSACPRPMRSSIHGAFSVKAPKVQKKRKKTWRHKSECMNTINFLSPMFLSQIKQANFIAVGASIETILAGSLARSLAIAGASSTFSSEFVSTVKRFEHEYRFTEFEKRRPPSL